MNQKGHSWPEAILTLGALVVIFGTLLPLATKMTSTLHNKKIEMHATETAYRGTIAYHANGKLSGDRLVEGKSYEWDVVGGTICVSFLIDTEVKTKCIEFY